METGSKQTHKSMNWMIALIIQWLLCMLPMGKIWHFSNKGPLIVLMKISPCTEKGTS